jgi:hypothetical protein
MQNCVASLNFPHAELLWEAMSPSVLGGMHAEAGESLRQDAVREIPLPHGKEEMGLGKPRASLLIHLPIPT